MYKLTAEQFDRFAIYIKNNMGVSFSENDKSRYDNLICGRIKELSLPSVEDYFDYLTFSSESAHEYNILSNYVCINETTFFRHPETFELLNDYLIKEILNNNKRGIIRILSAGCSNGAEPYSIAISFSEYFKKHNIEREYRILGIDIDKEALAAAEIGMYYGRSVLTNIQPEDNIVKNYFSKSEDGVYYIKPDLKKNVIFRYLNILNAEFPSEFDIIFIRNIMIYFSEEKNVSLMKKMYRMLSKNGFLITTNTEFMLDFEELFRFKKYKNLQYYQKWSTCKRNKNTNMPNVFEEKRTPTALKTPPEVNYMVSENAVVLTINGIISSNIDEIQFKKKISPAFYYISSKPLVIDIRGINYIDNIGLRHISETIPKDLNLFSKKNLTIVMNAKFLEFFQIARIDKYAILTDEMPEFKTRKSKIDLQLDQCDIQSESKTTSLESGISNENKKFFSDSSYQKIKIPDLPGDKKKLNTPTANIKSKQDSATKFEKKNSYVKKNNIENIKLKEISGQFFDKDNFKNYLIEILEQNVSEIVIDAKKTDFIDISQIPFFKRFIIHCEHLEKSLKILNADKPLLDFFKRHGINISIEGDLYL